MTIVSLHLAGSSALIGARNFFEVAVATAVGLFGVHSGAALATVAGMLIEVLVMLSVVRIVKGSHALFVWRRDSCDPSSSISSCPAIYTTKN